MLWPQRTLNLNILLNQFTSSSKCNIGTRQGELSTPMLFSLYINDLYIHIIIKIIKTLFNENACLQEHYKTTTLQNNKVKSMSHVIHCLTLSPFGYHG